MMASPALVPSHCRVNPGANVCFGPALVLPATPAVGLPAACAVATHQPPHPSALFCSDGSSPTRSAPAHRGDSKGGARGLSPHAARLLRLAQPTQRPPGALKGAHCLPWAPLPWPTSSCLCWRRALPRALTQPSPSHVRQKALRAPAAGPTSRPASSGHWAAGQEHTHPQRGHLSHLWVISSPV